VGLFLHHGDRPVDLDGASKTLGYAIKVREFAKFAKCNSECMRQGVTFLTLVME
jgi:hypothetical protein